MVSEEGMKARHLAEAVGSARALWSDNQFNLHCACHRLATGVIDVAWATLKNTPGPNNVIS
eukprot:scaffold9105_cov169-Ochromonas_danica.AAC.3